MEISDFMDAFLEELDEQLLQMEQQILELERSGGDDETVQHLFRAAHTLKGSSAAMGQEEMKQLTHEMEQVMDEVRSHRLRVSPDMIQLLFRCCDGLKVLQEGLISGGQQAPVDIAPLLDGLRRFVAEDHVSGKNEPAQAERRSVQEESSPVQEASASVAVESPAAQEASASVAVESPAAQGADACGGGETASAEEDEPVELDAEARNKAMEGLRQGFRLYGIHIRFSSISVMRGARAYVAVTSLKDVGEIVAMSPRLDEMEDSEDNALLSFHLIFLTSLDESTLRNLVFTTDFESVSVRTITMPAHDGQKSAEKLDADATQ
ncbi:MAG: Hpt domain-containing protein, partial [Bacilli bacterium]